MKRTLSLLLSLIMCMSAFVLSSSADELKNVFGAESLEYVVSTTTDFSFELLEEKGEKYIHYTCEAGSYGNSDVCLNFTPEGLSLYDYPYVRINYRTNSARSFGMSMYSKKGESWMGSGLSPATIGDGKWHDVIINMNDMTGGKGVLDSSETGVMLTVKPFGSHSKTLNDPGYVDYKFIACFKTLKEAESFKYTGETDPINMGVEIEKVPYYPADRAYVEELDRKTDKRIEEIINSPTEVEVTGTKYYVAANGCDADDGLTPDTAWQTINKVNSFKFNDGDGVFFKRGDSFRTTVPLKSAGITLSAYGSGAKPKIIASVDASGADKWSKTEYENVWVFDEAMDGPTRDVGTIVFDGGRAWGIKVTRTENNVRVDNGLCSNGYDAPFEVDDPEFIDERDLAGSLEFFHNWDDGKIYLYFKDGNPGDVFTSIEIVDKGHAISMGSNTVIDNLEVFGTGSHGIGGGTVENVLVQNCVLSWIGGSLQHTEKGKTTRFGNAVESYGSSDNYTIRNCYATQVYDCCFTAQVQGPGTFNNVKFYNNVAEYSNTGLEVWQEGGKISNMDLYNNITRYNGYGWSHQRPNKSDDIFKNDKGGNPYYDGNAFYGGFGGASTTYENNHVRNNINYLTGSKAHALYATGPKQYNFHDNFYLMPTDKKLGSLAKNPGRGTGGMWGPLYTEENILKALKTGFEAGSEFYYVEAGYEVPMYDPKNGVSVFDDVADNFWGRDYIDFVTLKGLFNGVSESKFSPDGKMTRAMLVTVLGRLSGEDIERAKTTSFTDVNVKAWYAPYVSWAEANGIIDTSLTKFRPDDNATREELADMLYRFSISEFKDNDLSNVKLDFTDVSKVGNAYINGIKFCTSNGIIGGYSDGSIKPQNFATRTEVSAMIERFVKYLTHADADVEKMIANSKSEVYTGTDLRKMIVTESIRANALDAKIDFVPFTQSGNPVICINDYMAAGLDFVDYPIVVVKYNDNLDYETSAALMYKVTASYEMKTTGIVASAGKDDNYIIIDCSPYYNTISKSAYSDDCAVYLYPWGNDEVTFGENDMFTIESVSFFENSAAAERYIANAG